MKATIYYFKKMVVLFNYLFATTVVITNTLYVLSIRTSSVPPNFKETIDSFAPSNENNMNGNYVFSTTPNGIPNKFPKQYKDYPGGAEFYDAYSAPITTRYSQVWWQPLPPTKLPADMVQKYANKKMAIIGWEIDQVVKGKTSKEDVSVPISASYNHHYVSHIVGAGASFQKIYLDGPNDPRAKELAKHSGHGMISVDQPQYIVEQGKSEKQKQQQPSVQTFSSSNGGEYRKTYHGFPPGYALVVHSPTEFQLTPMQIDTWNREKMNFTNNNVNSTNFVKFVAGPMPRASQAPRVNPRYSGLLECPMTTRLSKVIDDGTYLVKYGSKCAESIVTYQECFRAAAESFPADSKHVFNNNKTVSNSDIPPGCSLTVEDKNPLHVNIVFNELSTSSRTCAFDASIVSGATSSLVYIGIDLNKESATITLEGPSSVWFGVGFGAQAMADLPWTIVIDGNGNVTERKLSNHAGGKLLPTSIKVLSNTVKGDVRTVVLTRPLKGLNENYYTFDVSSTNGLIPIINAIGSTSAFGYHKNKAPSKVLLIPSSASPFSVYDGITTETTAGACVCPEKPKQFGLATGHLQYHNVPSQKIDTGSGSVAFAAQKCAVFPSTILNEQRNPTCDIRYYRGGQWACHHMWSLLDADQEIPWANEPLVLHHKYRFWVQPFNETYHTPVRYGFGTQMLIGSPWEYDVPKCQKNVPGCSLSENDGTTWIHTITGGTIANDTLITLNFHCHAPTCLSMEVYACEKGTLVKDCNATSGKLICKQEPVYGGSGNSKIEKSRFDEPGYIAIPDCFWGSEEFGLEKPLNLKGVPLHMVKRSNGTIGHYGEMAGGQPWVV